MNQTAPPKLSSLGKSSLANRSLYGREMSLLRVKNGGSGGGEGSGVMPTMRPVSMGRPLVTMSTYQVFSGKNIYF